MGLGLSAPVATDDGKPIVKTVREEFCSGTRGGNLETFKLSYEAVTLEQPRARLTVRERADDEPHELPLNQWSFVDARSIKLRDGTKPKPGISTSSTTRPRIPRSAGLRGNPRCRELAALRSAAIKATGGGSATRWPSVSPRPAATCATISPRASIATKRVARSLTVSIRTSPASAASSSTRPSASRRAPARSTRTTPSRRTSFPSRRPRSPIR